MSNFKNKYYKVFPLSIFITKCTEETVTFENAGSFNIYTTIVEVNDSGELKDKDNPLFHNGENYTINKKYDENNIIPGPLCDKKGSVFDSTAISKALENYVYAACIVKDKGKNRIKNYKIKTDGFNKEYTFQLYFYKIMNNKVSLYNQKRQKINLDEVNEKKNLFNITDNEDFHKIGTYREKIYFILKQLFQDINSTEDSIISIDGTELNKEDNENLDIYSNFIEKLQDGNYEEDKKIKIVLDDYYIINITDVLLSENLKKIYKITDDKKNKIIGILNENYYDLYKYKELQKELYKENVKIENGYTEKEITDLNKVTITITEDPSKNYITPKKCTIKFEAGNNLFITDSTKYQSSKIIDFSNSEGGITTETVIDKYINEKYPKIKDKCTITKKGDNSGKFEDGTIVTVTINEEIKGITTKKDSNKVYIKVQFKVSDTNKFKFKGSLVNINEFNLEFEKNKNISDLLAKIKEKLGNKDLKDGYKIELDNTIVNNNPELVDNANYIITLADDDTNFVEEIKEKPKDEHKDDNHEEHVDGNINDNQNSKEQKKVKCCAGGSGKKKNN